MSNSNSTTPILNAYVDGGDLVLVGRDSDGNRTLHRRPAEYVAYFKATDLARVNLYLRSAPRITLEDGWARVAWTAKNAPPHTSSGDPAKIRKYMDGQIAPLAYEADVHPVRRFLVDNVPPIAKPKRLYLDIETDSRVPFARKEEARILSIAMVATDGRNWTAVLEDDTDEAEAQLLAGFWQIAADFDQLVAWNGDGFDFPVIQARTLRCADRCPEYRPYLGPPTSHPSTPMGLDMRQWLWLDHLKVFDRMHLAAISGDEKTSLKLNDVCQAVLGEGKTDFDASKTWEVWESKRHVPARHTADRLDRLEPLAEHLARRAANREMLRTYNLQDTDLLRRLEEKTGYIELFQTLCEATGVLPDSQGLNPTQQVDSFLLRLGRERGHRFPTKTYSDEKPKKFAGAYVMKPTAKGITKNVHVADFASLYPSIILTWNTSPETKVANESGSPTQTPLKTAQAATGTRFLVDREGMLPAALATLIGLRKQWNERKASLPPGTPEWSDADRRATAYKVAANSFYGVIGSPYSRYYDYEIGEAITQSGVWLIKSTQAEAEKRGMDVVYCDTDSLFVVGGTVAEFSAFVEWCNTDLYPRILKERGCMQGVLKNHVKLAYEKQFERIVFTSAKRYVGRYAHYKGKAATADSKPEIKGLEYKRGDASALARQLQLAVIDLLCSGCEDQERYRVVVETFMRRVLHGDLSPSEVALSKTLSKPVSEYTRKTKDGRTVPASLAHLTVARQMQAEGEQVETGTRVSYVVKDGERKAGKPLVPIHAKHYDGTNADRAYLWERLVYPPTMRLLEAAFPPPEMPAPSTIALSEAPPPQATQVQQAPCGTNWKAYAKVRIKNPNQLSMF